MMMTSTRKNYCSDTDGFSFPIGITVYRYIEAVLEVETFNSAAYWLLLLLVLLLLRLRSLLVQQMKYAVT
jgi:hypothetical protein